MKTKEKIEKAIRKVLGNELAFEDVTLEEEMDGYWEFGFQVDDRIFDDTEEELSANITKALGWSKDDAEKGVSSDRRDAFTSGHAYYVVTVENLEENSEE